MLPLINYLPELILRLCYVGYVDLPQHGRHLFHIELQKYNKLFPRAGGVMSHQRIILLT